MMTEPKQEIITTPSGHNQHTIQITSAQHTPTPSSSRSKPQACKVCGKMLSSASSYYVHMKLHSGTKPFACTVCEAAFCRKPYLEVHMRTHTGKSYPYIRKKDPLKQNFFSGERPFECDLCFKRFSQKSSLNTHRRIHTGKSSVPLHSLFLLFC